MEFAVSEFLALISQWFLASRIKILAGRSTLFDRYIDYGLPHAFWLSGWSLRPIFNMFLFKHQLAWCRLPIRNCFAELKVLRKRSRVHIDANRYFYHLV